AMEVPAEPSALHTAAALPSEPPPAPVQITVLGAQDLKAIKSDVLVTLVRVEYNRVLLGDSPTADVLPNGTANYNFTASFECSPNGPNSLDVIAEKPLLLTVIEVLQMGKKQKEKTVPLGQAVVDLLPLLQGECSFEVSAPLYAVPASPAESLHPEAKGSLEVTVSTTEPLLSATQLSTGNLLSVTLEAAYSIPEAFAASEPLQNYMACLQVPAAGKKEFPLLFKNGVLKADGEKEPLPRPKKWPLGNILASGALSIPNSTIVGGPYEDEDGELTTSEDREFRLQAEGAKRIVWDVEQRCYLDAAAVASLQQRIGECQYWPLELCGMAVHSSSKGKASKGDKGDPNKHISVHGVAYVNMMPLLCPGVKQIRGAFRVFGYQDSEVFKKTKSQHSVFRDLMLQLNLTKEESFTPRVRPSLSRAVPSKTQREDKDKDSNRKLSSASRAHLSDSTDNVTNLNLDGQLYNEAETFVVLEIKLEKALVPKRRREELTRQVKEMIPSRPPLPLWTEGAKEAVEGYHTHVKNVAAAILTEYHELFGKPEQGERDHQTLEEQKCQLNYELNTSGKYFAFKEELKYSVVKIVREKYLKTTAFESQQQLQAFLSELYVYLVDQMHVALNQFLFEEDASPAPPSCTTQEQLWLFAREAEVNKDYKLATLYHQQRIAQDQHNIQSWLDYGAFCLLHEEATKAQECFQEALRLDPQHTQSLLLCGVTAVLLQHYEEAEVFFEDACCLEPSSIIAWTLSGLFYELQDNNIQAERNFREAKKILRAQLDKERSISKAAEGGEGEKDASSPGSGPHQPPCTIFMQTVEFLIKVNAVQVSSTGSGGVAPAYFLAGAQIHWLKEDLPRCEEYLHKAARIDPTNPNVWAQRGHLCYLKRDFGKAKECYERTISFVEDAVDMHFVYLHLGSIYLEEKEYGKAKQTYLLACDHSASCLTWLGVGIACYRLEEMVEAEDALSEANALNNTNAEVWAYLTLICTR
ncbi:PREDICTED: tetratricopeptide repeat protein 18, partial [Acanthisitta chloris]|uniref:tetratricopeptide repeat protein 18 n=1 Tax=Acanthisitta chloris TaxID=57068 RepID=UPI0004F0F399